VLGKLLVFFLVPFELLLFLLPDPAIDILLFAPSFKYSLDDTEFLSVTDILGIHGIQVAFTQGQVMDRIQNIGLPHPVFTHKTIDPFGQVDIHLFIILKIDQRKGLKMHTQKYYFLLLLREFFKTNK
jgi:hypothetical protein